VSSCCTSRTSTSRLLSTRICLNKPIPQSTYNTLANPKMLGYFYRVIIEYCTIVVGVENPHKFWMCRSLVTLDKLVDKFTLPPEPPPIGDTSLTHVMKLAAHSTTPPTPTTMVQYFYYDGITFKHSNSPIHFKLIQIPSSFHIWQKQYGTTVQYIHTNWDK
jgi:hypothetical protein